MQVDSVYLVGDAEPSLRELLSDVLSDLGLCLAEPAEARPRIALASIGSHDAAKTLKRAIAVARGAPVIALLPLGDHRSRWAIALGASAVYELSTPIDRLSEEIKTLGYEKKEKKR